MSKQKDRPVPEQYEPGEYDPIDDANDVPDFDAEQTEEDKA